MENCLKLTRGGGKQPRSRDGAPQVRIEYRDDGHVPLEISTPSVRAKQKVGQDKADYSSLVERFAGLALPDSGKSVKRRKYGKLGNAISLRTNLFELVYPEDLVLYDYKIIVEPDISTVDKETRMVLFHLFERSKEVAPFICNVVHDGARRLISSVELPVDFATTVYFYEDDGDLEPRPVKKEYVFRVLDLKQLRLADLSRHLCRNGSDYCPEPIISAFNLILTSCAAHTGVRTGRKGFYFYPPTALVPPECTTFLSTSLEAWRGISLTVIPMYKRLTISINTGMSAFYIPRNRFSDMFKCAYLRNGIMDAMAFYNGIKVTTSYLGYCRFSRIKGFGAASARRTLVYVESMGGELTVEQYFTQKHGILLEHADDLPVVNIGSKDKDVFIPAEVCWVDPGQGYPGTLSRDANTVLAQCNTKAVRTTSQDINMQAIHMLDQGPNGQPIISFGIGIILDNICVTGRILSPPRLCYQSGYPRIVNGSWSTRGVRFAKPTTVSQPAVLVILEQSDANLHDEMALRLKVINFFASCRYFGMQIGTALPSLHILSLPPKKSDDLRRREAISAVERKLISISEKPGWLLAFLPKDPRIFAGLKLICDTKLGIHCLCLSSPKDARAKNQNRSFSSLAMKLNTMLGGINHVLHPNSLQWLKDTMLVGMATAQYSTEGLPRVTAVVASRDMNFVHYPASFSIQGHKQGSIPGLRRMIVERLEEYRRHMNDLPQRIIIFHRGVPDSQIRQIMGSEIPEIRKAFDEFKQYSPKLTFIVCSRGHRLRFYPAKDQDTSAPTGITAGTVIDRGVASVQNSGFYLHAHPGTLRTSRATRYAVIINENKFNGDTLQQGINNLCYLWPFSSSSVSLVPPAYWAKRACQRVGLYFRELASPIRAMQSGRVDEIQVAGEKGNIWEISIRDEIKNTMFYL